MEAVFILFALIKLAELKALGNVDLHHNRSPLIENIGAFCKCKC